MKNLILLILVLTSFIGVAQVTPIKMIMLQKETGVSSSRAASFANPYVGAKLAYNVQGDVSNSIVLSGQAMFIPVSGDRYALPVLTNISLNNPDSLSNDAGLSLGLHPFYRLTTDESLRLFLHGGLIYNIVDKKDIAAQSRFRALAGIEAALYPKDEGSPITIGIAPEIIWDIQDVTTKHSGLGITGVLPIANSLGLLIEGFIPFTNGMNTGLQVGVIIANEVK